MQVPPWCQPFRRPVSGSVAAAVSFHLGIWTKLQPIKASKHKQQILTSTSTASVVAFSSLNNTQYKKFNRSMTFAFSQLGTRIEVHPANVCRKWKGAICGRIHVTARKFTKSWVRQVRIFPCPCPRVPRPRRDTMKSIDLDISFAPHMHTCRQYLFAEMMIFKYLVITGVLYCQGWWQLVN